MNIGLNYSVIIKNYNNKKILVKNLKSYFFYLKMINCILAIPHPYIHILAKFKFYLFLYDILIFF